VERTFGWLSKFRRLAKDYEYRPDNSEAVILIAATRLMLARLASTYFLDAFLMIIATANMVGLGARG
jgi:hypothetical protein